MVIAKDRHRDADRATRLEKAFDDEASANRTELEQGQNEKEHRVWSVLPTAKF